MKETLGNHQNKTSQINMLSQSREIIRNETKALFSTREPTAAKGHEFRELRANQYSLSQRRGPPPIQSLSVLPQALAARQPQPEI